MPQHDPTSPPAAPYPPMHYGSLARSSEAPTPQYRAQTEGSRIGMTSPVGSFLGENELEGTSFPRSQFADLSVKPNQPQQTTVSRVRFYPNGTLACINAAATIARSPEEESQRNRKMGPVLLELRSLELSEDDEEALFQTKTIALSRGNPQLGTSVSSTCLDVPVVQQYTSRMAVATGLTTGMLAVHTFCESPNDEGLPYASAIEYYHISRHHRQSSAVSWRPSQNNYVAIGLLGTGNPGPQQGPRRGGSVLRGGGDREFCAFLWDVEAAAGKRNAAPISKLSHNTPVASLAWVMDGQTLAVGTHSRTVQLYDMRVSGTNAPPLSALAHNFGVHGIEVHPHNPNIMATFCRSIGEPVKLWDVRRMDSTTSEIKIASVRGKTSEYANDQAKVEAVCWSPVEPSVLSVAIRDSVQDYDVSSGSRPVLIRVCHAKQDILDFALFSGSSPVLTQGDEKTKKDLPNPLVAALYSRRMMAILGDRSLCDLAMHGGASPVAISRRDGRLVHAFGSTVWIGSTTSGPAAMEKSAVTHDEDISATMMRRARCFRVTRYSMDTSQNIQMLSEDIPLGIGLTKDVRLSKLSLYRLWVWIERIESLSLKLDETELEPSWPARSLLDVGAMALLRQDGPKVNDAVAISETLACNIYSSSTRSLALTSCGWAGKFSLDIVLAECEALGEYERSAALAVWHGDIGAAVEALQRASGAMRDQKDGKRSKGVFFSSSRYAETLDLVAMCVAGYGGTTPTQQVVWRNACSKLLQRPDLTNAEAKTSRTAYLRAMCQFLLNVGLDTTFEYILANEYLAYGDRVAFACRFLDQQSLEAYLSICLEKCQQVGNVEGLVVTGMSKDGIKILQAFVDRTCDVQTASLVVSRVLLPQDWVDERKICMEWVEAYRGLLNSWQMWQSRAMFDVDRADALRRMKAKGSDAVAARRIQNRRQASRANDLDVMASIPAALDARCNYCSSPLGLRRHEGNANQWLSKMKPVLSCCPQCRKPLPRCSICLLGLGVLNPYMQLTRERSRPISRNPMNGQDDLGALPLAEWFTWCMNCKHGGHAHHLVGWFANHETCPVSGCNCHCQFDGIQKLSRPALAKKQDEVDLDD